MKSACLKIRQGLSRHSVALIFFFLFFAFALLIFVGSFAFVDEYGLVFFTVSNDTLTVFRGTLPYYCVSVLGICVALFSIHRLRLNQRRQDTLKILLESRLSEYHMKNIESARRYLDQEEEPVSGEKFESDLDNGDKGALATRAILNYYDFISAGILLKNLNEEMLHKTIRGMLCRVVFDASLIIRHIRVDKKRQKSYENLVTIYDKWAESHERKKGLDLGPTLP